MTSFRIKNVTERDVPQIVRMIRDFAEFEKLSQFCEVTEERLSAAIFGAKPCVEGLIALENQEDAIGYALFFENFASFRGQRGVYLEDLYVVPEQRKSGVGSALVKHLANLANQRGCERMDWQVLKWNDTAIRFYQKIGAELDQDERHFRLVGANFEKLANRV